MAEAEGGGAFPGGGEPDRFGELDVAEPVRQEHHGAAAFDRGELFLVPRQDQLAPVAGGVLGEGGQMGEGDHGAFGGQDQRAGRECRPSFRSASRRVVSAAWRMPAWRRPLVAFWEVAVPTTGPSQARAMAASPKLP